MNVLRVKYIPVSNDLVIPTSRPNATVITYIKIYNFNLRNRAFKYLIVWFSIVYATTNKSKQKKNDLRKMFLNSLTFSLIEFTLRPKSLAGTSGMI